MAAVIQNINLVRTPAGPSPPPCAGHCCAEVQENLVPAAAEAPGGRERRMSVTGQARGPGPACCTHRTRRLPSRDGGAAPQLLRWPADGTTTIGFITGHDGAHFAFLPDGCSVGCFESCAAAVAALPDAHAFRWFSEPIGRAS
jgi:hypothetical protein